MRPDPLRRPLAATALSTAALLAHAGDKGDLGIQIAVDGEEAFRNPTLKAMRIAQVVPGSPADQAGMAAA